MFKDFEHNIKNLSVVEKDMKTFTASNNESRNVTNLNGDNSSSGGGGGATGGGGGGGATGGGGSIV